MLIASKLTKPNDPQHMVVRERLLHSLNQSIGHKLILVCSPAGYGKTTTIAQWCQDQENVAWYSLDKFDDDIYRFANYLIQSISDSYSERCSRSLELAQNRSFPNLTTLFTQLFDETSAQGHPLTLILDDYHCIENQDIHLGIKFFIRYMPANWRIVITSRTRPLLSVSNLRIRQQLLEIDTDKLAFDIEETRAFFEQRLNFPIESNLLTELRNDVEGWPSALQLVALSAKDPDHFSQCAEQVSNSQHAHLWDYLEDEVFALLPDQQKRLLLDIAPLARIDAEMINALCGFTDGQATLEAIEEQGLFLVAQDNQKQWFRFHALFKGFLLHLKAQDPNRQQDDKNLALLWLKRKMPMQALPHVVYSRDEELTVTLLQQSGWALFHEGEFSSLDVCFDQLKETIWCYPDLVLLKAWMLHSRWRNHEVTPLLEKAQAWMDQQGITLEPSLLGEFEVVRAQVAINQGEVKCALDKAKFALSLLPSTSIRSQMVGRSIIGEANHCLGKLNQAYQCQEEVKILALEHQFYQNAVWALYQQIEILHAQANPLHAERLIEQALELLKNHNLDQLPLLAYPLHFRAQLAYQAYDLSLATELCERALRVVAPYGEQWLLFCYSLKAKIALESGDMDIAVPLIGQMESLLHTEQYHSDWLANANYVRIKYWRQRGDIAAIRHWLESAPEPEAAFNHFDQCHWRNRVRALTQLGKLNTARELLLEIMKDARRCQLQVEVNRNLILLASIDVRLQDINNAKANLAMALETSLFTGLITSFIRESANLNPILQELAKETALTQAVKDKLSQLLTLSGLDQQQTQHTPFAPPEVDKILAHPSVPGLVKNISLTQREWEVLGFIYSGYTNDNISKAMSVAPTTVKSHIRNLYQKLGLAGRNEAISLGQHLLSLT